MWRKVIQGPWRSDHEPTPLRTDRLGVRKLVQHARRVRRFVWLAAATGRPAASARQLSAGAQTDMANGSSSAECGSMKASETRWADEYVDTCLRTAPNETVEAYRARYRSP